MKRCQGLWQWCLWTAVGTVLLFAGCSRPHDDAQVASEVRSRISADAKLRSQDFTVQAANGVITLSGYSNSDAERMAAAADAADVSGVRTVVNDLQVKALAMASQPAAPNPSPRSVANSPAPRPVSGSTPVGPAIKPTIPRPAPRSSAHRSVKVAKRETAHAAAKTEALALPYTAGPVVHPAPAAAPNSTQAHAPSAVASAPGPPTVPAPVTKPSPLAAVTPAPAKIAVPNPAPKPVTIPSGTTLSIRLVDAINSSRSQPGETFRATLDAPLADDSGAVVIPAGQDVTGRIVEAKSAGRLTGKSSLALELTELSDNGRHYTLHTDQIHREGKSEGVSTAKKAGGGAALGALIGALAGGGKGAAIGAVIGAGAGTGVSSMKKGKPVVLPSETLLSFSLQEPLSVLPGTAGAQTAAHAQQQSAAESNAESNPAPTPGDDNGPPVLKRRGSGSQPK